MMNELDIELEHILAGFEGQEIDENLIYELSEKGFPADELRSLGMQGFKYFRGTNSFFIPLV